MCPSFLHSCLIHPFLSPLFASSLFSFFPQDICRAPAGALQISFPSSLKAETSTPVNLAMARHKFALNISRSLRKPYMLVLLHALIMRTSSHSRYTAFMQKWHLSVSCMLLHCLWHLMWFTELKLVLRRLGKLLHLSVYYQKKQHTYESSAEHVDGEHDLFVIPSLGTHL